MSQAAGYLVIWRTKRRLRKSGFQSLEKARGSGLAPAGALHVGAGDAKALGPPGLSEFGWYL